MPITYEWIVEEMDGDEIVDTSAFDKLSDAKKFAGGPSFDIGLRRDVVSTVDGVTDRQHAYPGDTQFEGGAEIPQKMWTQLNSLVKS